MKKTLMIVAMVAVIGMAGTAEAIVYNFTGGGGTDWDTAGNWTPGGPATLPDFQGGDDVTVLGAQSTTCAAGTYVRIGNGVPGTSNVTINTTATLLFGEGLGLASVADAVVSHQNGTLTVDHYNTNSGGLTVGGGPGNCTYTMTGGAVVPEHSLWMGGSGTGSLFDQQAGTVTVGDFVDWHGADNHRVDLMQIANSVDSPATYRISGGSLEVNSQTGTSHYGGLHIGGWHYYAYVPGYFYDGGAGKLEIVGTDPTGVTVNGRLIVGGNPGGGGKGALSFVMGAGGVTPLTVNGVVDVAPYDQNYGGSPQSDLLIDMSGLGGGVGDIPLIVNDGTDAIVGEFDGAPEGTMYGGYMLTYVGGDGNDLVLEGSSGDAIPEPAGLGLIGLALLAVRRKRS